MILTDHNREIAIEMVKNADNGMVLELRKPKRSLDQNRYYWAVLTDISEQVVPGKAYEPSIYHEYFKSLFLQEKIVELPDGSMKMLEPSTSGLNKDTFSEYLEKVIKWSIENNVTFSEHTKALQHGN